jgi:hypothetical protein
MDALPQSIRHSSYLTGNHLGQLANVHEMPAVSPTFDDEHVRTIIQYFSLNPTDMEREIHTYAAKLLEQNRVDDAWQVLLVNGE